VARSGEQHAIDAFVRGQRLAFLGRADQHLREGGRHPGAMQALHQAARGRRLFRWLEHHGIAGDQRGMIWPPAPGPAG
jgi:hypothetical protein